MSAANNTRALMTLLAAAAAAACGVLDETEMTTYGNREIYHLPASAGTAFSDLCFLRDGAPNTNPAVLAFDSAGHISMAYAGYFKNAYSSSMLSLINPLGRLGTVGVSLSYVLIPDIVDTRDWTVDGDGLLIVPQNPRSGTSSEVFLHAAYSKLILDGKKVRLGLGAGLNAHRLRLLELAGYGIGLDAGMNCAFPRKGLRVSLLAENVVTEYVYWNSDFSQAVYPHLRLGLGWQKDIPYIYGHLRVTYASPDLLSNEGVNALTGENDFGEDGESPAVLTLRDPAFLACGNLGIEYAIFNTVHFRIGMQDIARFVLSSFTFGGGLSLFGNRVGLDFAYLPHDLSGTYALSGTYLW